MAVTKIQAEVSKSLFERCSEIDTTDITHANFNGIKYISWADAWGRLKKHFPDASYTIHRFGPETKNPYLKTEFGVFVEVTVTIEGVSYYEMLPVMDNKMNAISTPDGRDINDTIKRCLVKAMALHGFGLSLYQKDDLYAKEHPAPGVKSEPVMTKDYIFTFGKYKGKSFWEIPFEELSDYVNWLKNTDAKKNKPITDAFLSWEKAHKEAYSAAKPHTKTTYEMNYENPPPIDDSDIPF